MILNGAFRASREPLSDLFSEDPNFGRPIFRATMPRERFKVFLRFLRFDDVDTRPERQKSDNLAAIIGVATGLLGVAGNPVRWLATPLAFPASPWQPQGENASHASGRHPCHIR